MTPAEDVLITALLARAKDQRELATAIVKLCHSLIERLGTLGKEAVVMRAALAKIAAFDDEGASDHLAKTGSYGCFCEPAAVKIAREALAAMEQEKAA